MTIDMVLMHSKRSVLMKKRELEPKSYHVRSNHVQQIHQPIHAKYTHVRMLAHTHTHRQRHYIYLKMINAKNSKWVSERWWSTQKQFQWVRIIRTGSVFFRCSSAEPHTNKIKSAQRKMCKQRAALAINVSYDQCIFCPSIWFEQ